MAAIGYVCIGTSDFDRATKFYDALLGEIGGKSLMPTPQGLLYRLASGCMLMVTRPYDGGAAAAGNGNMVAINVDAQDDVARVYEKALALGGQCEGKPGPRGAFGEFAYFRDLDGNKLAVFYSARQQQQKQ
ncbi:VOC family protein [Terricaulis sp.]|uniref:VOC family protein n=1 Tax=Terricaulis sp. TaxID=2768686 RepID=UPI00378448C4